MLEQFGRKMNLPYMHGIYLAMNSIKDAYLLVDGPNCSFFKAEYIYCGHDFKSSLLDVGGYHRISHTDLHPDKIITGHEELVLNAIKKIAQYSGCRATFLSALPMAGITGIQYDSIVNEVAGSQDKPIFFIPGSSLEGDWIDGYEQFLISLAEGMDLETGKTDSRNAAIVGYFMDRNEGDHTANVMELRRILSAFDLNLASVWLNGEDFQSLKKIQSAGILISLPYGRKAAKIISKKTGAHLIEADMPFGIEDTTDFVKKIGQALDMKERAGEFIEQNLSDLIPPLEWLIPKRFHFKNLVFIGDPCFLQGFLNMGKMLGVNVKAFIAFKKKNKKMNADVETLNDTSTMLMWEPCVEELLEKVKFDDVDLIISNSIAAGMLHSQQIVLEFGFPSLNYHTFSEAPFLGYKGTLQFIDRMSNQLVQKSKRYSLD